MCSYTVHAGTKTTGCATANAVHADTNTTMESCADAVHAGTTSKTTMDCVDVVQILHLLWNVVGAAQVTPMRCVVNAIQVLPLLCLPWDVMVM